MYKIYICKFCKFRRLLNLKGSDKYLFLSIYSFIYLLLLLLLLLLLSLVLFLLLFIILVSL